MGNHEYCLECGASDFHYGSPCPPDRKAKFQETKKKGEEYGALLEARAREVCAKLVQLGYPARIGSYGHVVIEKWDLGEKHAGREK